MINFLKTRNRLQWLAGGLWLTFIVVMVMIGSFTAMDFAWNVALFCAAAFVGYISTK